MSRRVPFIDNEYYHVYNRGVEKRIIFKDKMDYDRFLFMLNEFNTEERVFNTHRQANAKTLNARGSSSNKRLVAIENYCLMPNHYHLCLRQLTKNGISKYLQKVMTGYTMYFNLRHKRSGALFQGKTKSRHVDTEKYFNYHHYYIDLNPLELLYPEWKEKGVPNIGKAREYLEAYPWHKRKNYKGETFNREKIAKYELGIMKPSNVRGSTSNKKVNGKVS